MSVAPLNPSGKIDRIARAFAEYGSYLYLAFLLFDRGEGLRNIGVYSAALGWAVLAVRGKVHVPSVPVSAFFLLYFLTAAISAALSVDPSYSVRALRDDLARPALIFIIIATFYDRTMLIRAGWAFGVAGIVVLAMGLYGFLTSGTGLYTIESGFLSLDKNEFGFYAIYLLPLLLYLAARANGRQRVFWGAVSLWCAFAAFLSASRGSIAGLFGMLLIWALMMFDRRRIVYAAIVCAVLGVLAAASFNFWPKPLQTTVTTLPAHIATMNDRTGFFWRPALQAVAKRPVFGWGYGKKLYRDPRPFEGTAQPNWDLKGGLHSTFIGVMFHQGWTGLAAYVLAILAALASLIRSFRRSGPDSRMLAAALVGLLFGAFVVNSLVLVVPIRRLAPVIGMAAAVAVLARSDGKGGSGADRDRT